MNNQQEEQNKRLYFDCNGSLEGRNLIEDAVSVRYVDCTGGQAAFEDGNLQVFGQEVIAAARKHNIKIYKILRMDDPGLGLMFTDEWVQDGLSSGRFQAYPIPKDVKGEEGGSGAEVWVLSNNN